MSELLDFEVTVTDDASLVLARYDRAINEDRTELNQRIATDALNLTRSHLEKIAPYNHKTAERLGATPTGYLTDVAELLTIYFDDYRATVEFPTKGLEIFQRTLGPVEVHAVNSKYLTIPATAEAYGKRAVEFKGELKFIPFANGTRALVKQSFKTVPGKRPGTTKKEVVNDVYYWLKESVLLPEDKTLLPSPEDYARVAAGSSGQFILQLFTDETFNEFLPKRLGGLS